MRYSFPTLMILLFFGPPLLAGVLVASKDSWPLFLALGYVTYIAGSVAVAIVVVKVFAWAIEFVEDALKRKQRP